MGFTGEENPSLFKSVSPMLPRINVSEILKGQSRLELSSRLVTSIILDPTLQVDFPNPHPASVIGNFDRSQSMILRLRMMSLMFEGERRLKKEAKAPAIAFGALKYKAL